MHRIELCKHAFVLEHGTLGLLCLGHKLQHKLVHLRGLLFARGSACLQRGLKLVHFAAQLGNLALGLGSHF